MKWWQKRNFSIHFSCQQLACINEQVELEESDVKSGIQWTDISQKPEILFDKEVSNGARWRRDQRYKEMFSIKKEIRGKWVLCLFLPLLFLSPVVVYIP